MTNGKNWSFELNILIGKMGRGFPPNNKFDEGFL